MSITISARPASSRRNSSPIPSHRDEFAREAALAAFGPKVIHHLSGSDFVDREPDSAGTDEIVDGPKWSLAG